VGAFPQLRVAGAVGASTGVQSRHEIVRPMLSMAHKSNTVASPDMTESRCCSVTYGSGPQHRRNTVISQTPLPRHHPEYDNFRHHVDQLLPPKDLCVQAKQALAIFDRQGVPCRSTETFLTVPRCRPAHCQAQITCDCTGEIECRRYAGLPNSRKRSRPWTGSIKSMDASAEQGSKIAQEMMQRQEQHQNSSSAQKMMAFRKKLPSFLMRESLLAALHANQVRSRNMICVLNGPRPQ
jgi:hypothetical protein